jgi:hypothetical protein
LTAPGASRTVAPVAEPSVRARHLKSALATADALPGGALLRAELPARLVEDVERASGFDWLPLEHDVEIVLASEAVLSPDEFERLWRGVVLDGIEGPLLGLLMRTAVRMFGHDPAEFTRWVPKGWAMIFRDVGVWTACRVTGGTAVLRVQGLPPACRTPAFPRSVACSLGAIPVLSGRSGGARVVDASTELGAASFEVSWGVAREASGA